MELPLSTKVYLKKDFHGCSSSVDAVVLAPESAMTI
jgi:hypothetical protein